MAISAAVYHRTVRFFSLNLMWALSLPVGGLLYGGMTLDSAARYVGRAPRLATPTTVGGALQRPRRTRHRR